MIKPLIKVSKKQKQLIDYNNEVIQGFFDKFLDYTDTRYWIWKKHPEWGDTNLAGEMVSYMIKAINDRPY